MPGSLSPLRQWRRVLALIIGASLSLCLTRTGAATRLAADPVPGIPALVARTIDGDSLDAYIDGKRTAVGYLGAESAPLNTPCGRQAQARNQQLADSSVFLLADPAYELDETGRRLFYAFTADGRLIDAYLIWEGLARASRTDGYYGAYLLALQADAQASSRGCIWETP
jgi:endonuclease YncB( thermonuclease family)